MNITQQIKFDLSQVKIDWNLLHLINGSERFDTSWIYIQQKERDFLNLQKVKVWKDINKHVFVGEYIDELLYWIDIRIESPKLIKCVLVLKTLYVEPYFNSIIKL